MIFKSILQQTEKLSKYQKRGSQEKQTSVHIQFFFLIIKTIHSMKEGVSQLLSCGQLFATPWTVACQASLSMGFFRQEYWSGQPFPSLGNIPGLLCCGQILYHLSHQGSPIRHDYLHNISQYLLLAPKIQVFYSKKINELMQ